MQGRGGPVRDLSTARFYHLLRLGGRTIGSTSDSGSDYPGSSPGLPAKIFSLAGREWVQTDSGSGLILMPADRGRWFESSFPSQASLVS